MFKKIKDAKILAFGNANHLLQLRHSEGCSRMTQPWQSLDFNRKRVISGFASFMLKLDRLPKDFLSI